MVIFGPEHLAHYLENDVILGRLREAAHPDDATFTSNRWLIESAPKRMIYSYVYGDLLDPSTRPKSVLDVGGGYCSLSRLICKNHHYILLDIMAHDSHEALETVQTEMGQKFWENMDWHEYLPAEEFDLVISNDLFPNVDQRLWLFLERYLPLCREMRLTLTYYNHPKFYFARRIDADEVLCVLSWTGEQVKQVLERFKDRLIKADLEMLFCPAPALFENRRHVCMVTLRGNRHG